MSTEVSALPLGKFVGSSRSDQIHGCGSSQYAPTIAQIRCNTRKRHQPSKDRWEDLKPFIRRVYIENGKTLQQLAESLRDKHDFYPTEKQLTKRLRDWGLRKNVNRKERKTIVENLDHVGDQRGLEARGKRITRAKLKRRKEIGKFGATDAFLHYQSTLPGALPQKESKQIINNNQKLQTQNPLAHRPRLQKTVLLLFQPATISGQTSQMPPYLITTNFLSKKLGHEYEKLCSSSSSSLDTLSRLLIAMKLQPSADTFRNCLQPPVPATPKTPTTNYLIPTDIMDLANDEPLKEMNVDQRVFSRLERSSDGVSPTNQQKGCSAFRFSDVDIFFPSDTQIKPNPFNELYPWPKSPLSTSRNASSCKTRFIACQRDISVCQEKFSKLKPFSPDTHPAMIVLMENMGYAYYHLGKASQAEHWYRFAVSVREQTEGVRSSALHHSWLGLIDPINAQGRYREAQILHQEIQPPISKAVAPDHSLVQKSLQIIAIISGNLGNQAEAEAYYRELVQIRLGLFGPRHGDTLAAMQRLASPLRRQERYSESEELLSIIIELSKSTPGMSDNRKCRGLSSLAKVLFHQGRYAASETLHRTAMEGSRSSLGDDHPATLQCGYHLAQTLRAQGLLEEAETLLRNTLDRQLSLFGENSPSTIDSISELGVTLEVANRHEEAIELHERALHGFLQVWGPDHDYTLAACEHLGGYYENLGRYDDAFALYYKLIEAIKGSKSLGGSKTTTIDEIQDWIDRMYNMQDFVGSQCSADILTNTSLDYEAPSTSTWTFLSEDINSDISESTINSSNANFLYWA